MNAGSSLKHAANRSTLRPARFRHVRRTRLNAGPSAGAGGLPCAPHHSSCWLCRARAPPGTPTPSHSARPLEMRRARKWHNGRMAPLHNGAIIQRMARGNKCSHNFHLLAHRASRVMGGVTGGMWGRGALARLARHADAMWRQRPSERLTALAPAPRRYRRPRWRPGIPRRPQRRRPGASR